MLCSRHLICVSRTASLGFTCCRSWQGLVMPQPVMSWGRMRFVRNTPANPKVTPARAAPQRVQSFLAVCYDDYGRCNAHPSSSRGPVPDTWAEPTGGGHGFWKPPPAATRLAPFSGCVVSVSDRIHAARGSILYCTGICVLNELQYDLSTGIPCARCLRLNPRKFVAFGITTVVFADVRLPPSFPGLLVHAV